MYYILIYTGAAAVSRYLKGSEPEIKHDLGFLQFNTVRLHKVEKQHVVHPKQRDQQEGGLSQTSGKRTYKSMQLINEGKAE